MKEQWRSQAYLDGRAKTIKPTLSLSCKNWSYPEVVPRDWFWMPKVDPPCQNRSWGGPLLAAKTSPGGPLLAANSGPWDHFRLPQVVPPPPGRAGLHGSIFGCQKWSPPRSWAVDGVGIANIDDMHVLFFLSHPHT